MSSRAIPSTRTRMLFALLVMTQAAHSIEEYIGRLWESFPPARYITGVVSNDRELGFLVLNLCLVAFGVWCLLWPVRRGWSVAAGLMWLWVFVQTINGLAHPLWSIRQGEYTPGLVTAPILLGLAILLARQLRKDSAMATHALR